VDEHAKRDFSKRNKVEKITASGVHPSPYGDVGALDGTTLGASAGRGLWKELRAPLIIFFVSLVFFCLFSWNHLKGASEYNHFAYQAEAFLAGQVELLEAPPNGNDWASFSEFTLESGQVVEGTWWNRDEHKFLTLDGELLIIEDDEIAPAERHGREPRHYFVSFPPGPAVLMMPGVAIWGTAFNDVWFTLFFAALGMALLYVLLRKLSRGGRTGRSASDNIWLVVMAGFGSVFLFSAVLGQVWYTALIVGFAFCLLHLLFAIDAKHPLLAGLFLACGFATRTPLLFTAVVFPLFLMFPGGRLRRGEWGMVARKLTLFCIFPLIVGIALLAMNYARFGHITEFGHRFLANGEIGRIRDYGLFNYHFIARNLSAAFTLMPRIQPDSPYINLSEHGMSLFLTTPAWLYLFKTRPRQFAEDVFWHRLMWACVLVIMIPHMLYQNTGWVQYGYRFSIDYTPFLVVLLAIGRYPQTKVFRLLVIIGIVVSAFGAITFARYTDLYVGWFFDT